MIYNFKIKEIGGNEISMNDYKGKVLLIVNTATGCGFTPQYEALQKIYDKYRDKGFEILDFPCNQFFNQAPGDDEEIKSFCTLNYGTTFRRFSKIDVNGEGADPVYKYLRTEAPEADEDGKFTKKRLGNTVPTVTGGFGINMRYKNFDLSAFFNYSLGNKIVNATKLGSSYYNDTKKGWNLNDNFTLAKRYSWIDPSTGENMLKSSYIKSNGLDYTINRLNEINAGASMYNPGSITEMPLLDWALEDGSFLRVNNISIGYTLPKVFVNKMFMQNVRIYVTGYNLYCFTKYSGADPEVDTRRSTPMTPGVDYSAYPKSRSFVGGINVTF